MTSLPRLYVLGDSISIHYGPWLEAALRGNMTYDRKGGLVGDLDDPEGANGGDSRRVLSYLKRRRQEGGFSADFLLLNCGLHDVRRNPGSDGNQVPLPEYRENLKAIASVSAEMKLRVIWVRTTPVCDEVHNARTQSFQRYEADVGRYNREADTLMAGLGVAVIDLHAFTRQFLPDGLIDHVHFDATTCERQGRFIAKSLSEELSDRRGDLEVD